MANGKRQMLLLLAAIPRKTTTTTTTLCDDKLANRAQGLNWSAHFQARVSKGTTSKGLWAMGWIAQNCIAKQLLLTLKCFDPLLQLNFSKNKQTKWSFKELAWSLARPIVSQLERDQLASCAGQANFRISLGIPAKSHQQQFQQQ